MVVCTRDRGASAAAAVETLLANSYPGLEILLVDQSANAETRMAVERFQGDARFRYIASGERGVARARNLGLAAASGELVLFTDDDCEVPPDWAEKMAAAFEHSPQVAVVFCNVLPAAHDPQAGFIPAYTLKKDRHVRNMWDKCRARGIGAGMGVRKQAALRIGGFDNALGPGAAFGDCEDGDMAVRALLTGFEVYETCETAVIHAGFRTWLEGKSLARRNWVGIGAAYAKALHCGRWQILPVIGYEAFVVALLQPLSRLLLLRPPRGLKTFYYFWVGFFRGLRFPVDRRTMRFLEPPAAEAGRVGPPARSGS